MRVNETNLAAEQVREMLDYDPLTGRFTWRVHRQRFASGTEAGWTDNSGYRRIKLQGQKHQAHRLAWLHYFGEWPSVDVDHIDGDRANNRIVNLRLATTAQNAANRRMPRTNSSGLKGASFYPKLGRWLAKIVRGGKHYHLGYFDTAEEAHAAYAAAAREFSGKYARVR